jgi:hypothetical protein
MNERHGKQRKKAKWDSYVGRQINGLVILSHQLEKRGTRPTNSTYFVCRCECGAETSVKADQVIRGSTVSCGCRKKLYARNARTKRMGLLNYVEGQAASYHLYAQYRLHALRRNYEWSLNREEFLQLTKQDCVYCGSEPRTICKPTNGCFGEYIYNGLDRLVNSIGYTIENCVPCCARCNKMKGVMSSAEFIEHCKKVSLFSLQNPKFGA